MEKYSYSEDTRLITSLNIVDMFLPCFFNYCSLVLTQYLYIV